MDEMKKATVTMVKNAITSKDNVNQHETMGFYLNKDNENIYMNFGNTRVDMWHNGNHINSFEPKNVKDMKEAMINAKEIMNSIDKQVNLIVRHKEFNSTLEKLNSSVDQYKEKLGRSNVVSIEAMKMTIQSKFKIEPERSIAMIDALNNKIPDVASGKIQLPDLPVIKQQADINVSTNKQADQDRSR